jgi:hypothetical protein
MLERKSLSLIVDTQLFLEKFNQFLSIYEGWCPLTILEEYHGDLFAMLGER